MYHIVQACFVGRFHNKSKSHSRKKKTTNSIEPTLPPPILPGEYKECGASVEKQNLMPCSKCSNMCHETMLCICRTCELSGLLCAECSLEWHDGHELVPIDFHDGHELIPIDFHDGHELVPVNLELRRQCDLAAQRLEVVKDGLGQVARSVDEGVVKVLENLLLLNEAYEALKSSGIDDMQKRLSTTTIIECKNLAADAENKLSSVHNLLAEFINEIKGQKYNLSEYDELLAGRGGR